MLNSILKQDSKATSLKFSMLYFSINLGWRYLTANSSLYVGNIYYSVLSNTFII